MAAPKAIKLASPKFSTVQFKQPMMKTPTVKAVNTKISAPAVHAAKFKVVNKGMGLP